MKFAIILAGCGQHDGSETHEVVLTLFSLANMVANGILEVHEGIHKLVKELVKMVR